MNLLCQKNSQGICCMIFKDAEHSCFLLLPMENQDINLFTGRLTPSKKLQGREMQWGHDFHRLMWCRTILNLLKTSLSVKISIFHVHQGPPCSAALGGGKSKVNPVYIMYFAFCTLQCYVHRVQDSHRWLSSPYYENSFKYQLGTVLCSGVVSILLGW